MKVVPPSLFWKVIDSIAKSFPGDSFEQRRAIRYLVPWGRPGAGILHGRQNINKTLTYRIVHSPGFNKERDQRRFERSMEEHAPTATDFL